MGTVFTIERDIGRVMYCLPRRNMPLSKGVLNGQLGENRGARDQGGGQKQKRPCRYENHTTAVDGSADLCGEEAEADKE